MTPSIAFDSTTPQTQRVTDITHRTDVLSMIGIVDQALLALTQLSQIKSAHGVKEIPRSLFFNITRTHRHLSSRDREVSTLKLLRLSASCVSGLVRGWKQALRHEEHKPSAVRYYQIASIAAASLLVPWLLLKRAE